MFCVKRLARPVHFVTVNSKSGFDLSLLNFNHIADYQIRLFIIPINVVL